MRTTSDLLETAGRHGMQLVSLERAPVGSHGSTIAARFRFADPWDAARLLAELSDEDAADPVVRAWALAILRATAKDAGLDMSGPDMTAALRDRVARAIHQNVQRQIRFVRERRETFQAAKVTMAELAGDCDDHARLVHALARSIDLPARLHFFQADGQPVHVVDKIGHSLAWAETTMPAGFGEHPYGAYRRLRAEGRIPPRGDLGVD